MFVAAVLELVPIILCTKLMHICAIFFKLSPLIEFINICWLFILCVSAIFALYYEIWMEGRPVEVTSCLVVSHLKLKSTRLL